MIDCCLNDLGSLPHNEGVNIGIPAAQGGVHIAILFFSGVRIKRSFSVSLGSDIIIPKPFNEDYTYKLQVEQPDGTLLKSNDCENFAFKTYISVEETCGQRVCEEETIIYA